MHSGAGARRRRAPTLAFACESFERGSAAIARRAAADLAAEAHTKLARPTGSMEGIGLDLMDAKALLAKAKRPAVKAVLSTFIREMTAKELELLGAADQMEGPPSAGGLLAEC